VIICTSNIGSDMIRETLQNSGATPVTVDGGTNAAQTPADPNAPVDPNAQQTQTPAVNSADPNQQIVQNMINAQSQQANQQVNPQNPTVPNTPADPNNPQPVNPATPVAPPQTGGAASQSIVNDPGASADYKKLSSMLMEQLTKHFRPELINRFDEVVVFEPLTRENMELIAKLNIDSTKKMLKEQNVDLQISAAALAQLAKEGYDPAYGARPLRRLIQRSIENPIAIYLIDGSLKGGDTVLVDYDATKDQFVFRKMASAPQPPAGTPTDTTPAEATPTNDSAETVVEAPSETTDPQPEQPQTPDAGAGQSMELPKSDEASA
jgi:ATP-dependent Clp protease ATP-binding subunit ClpA